jgi:hypothetical protein
MRTGSHRNVTVRGNHKAEAIVFALSTATPITSMAVDRAAAKIVEACRARRARLTVGIQAKVAIFADALAPELTALTTALVARYLPHPPARAGGSAKWSRDLDLGWIATVFPRGAAARMNQPMAMDEV